MAALVGDPQFSRCSRPPPRPPTGPHNSGAPQWLAPRTAPSPQRPSRSSSRRAPTRLRRRVAHDASPRWSPSHHERCEGNVSVTTLQTRAQPMSAVVHVDLHFCAGRRGDPRVPRRGRKAVSTAWRPHDDQVDDDARAAVAAGGGGGRRRQAFSPLGLRALRFDWSFRPDGLLALTPPAATQQSLDDEPALAALDDAAARICARVAVGGGQPRARVRATVRGGGGLEASEERGDLPPLLLSPSKPAALMPSATLRASRCGSDGRGASRRRTRPRRRSPRAGAPAPPWTALRRGAGRAASRSSRAASPSPRRRPTCRRRRASISLPRPRRASRRRIACARSSRLPTASPTPPTPPAATRTMAVRAADR